MSNKRLDIINSVIFVFTVLGTNILDYIPLKIGRMEKILISILLLGAYFLILRKKGYEKFHSLPEGSRRFSKFFEKWYSKSGKLSIFCNDLEWLISDQYKNVVDALRRKGINLNLYLRNKGNDAVSQDLIRNGATLYNVKETIQSKHRLSIADDQGIKSIIIRNKDIMSNDIVFVETDSYRDPYLISLALDTLENCYE